MNKHNSIALSAKTLRSLREHPMQFWKIHQALW